MVVSRQSRQITAVIIRKRSEVEANRSSDIKRTASPQLYYVHNDCLFYHMGVFSPFKLATEIRHTDNVDECRPTNE